MRKLASLTGHLLLAGSDPSMADCGDVLAGDRYAVPWALKETRSIGAPVFVE